MLWRRTKLPPGTEADLPKGVWVEPNDGCVVNVYQEIAERRSAEIRGKRFASSAASAWVL